MNGQVYKYTTTMPAKPRFELFQQSANRFVRQFHRKFFSTIHTITYKSVDCIPTSASKQTYTLSIDKKYLSYENTVTGEKVYELLPNLTPQLLKEELKQFYRPFQIRNDEGKVISYCKVDRVVDDIDNEKMICWLDLLYHNRYEKPFPCEERDIEQIQELKREVRHHKKMAQALSRGHGRMIHTIRELFAKLPTKPDCPVCYVEMAVDKLAINPCCHLLCSDCNNRLVRDKKGCPECRGPITI